MRFHEQACASREPPLLQTSGICRKKAARACCKPMLLALYRKEATSRSRPRRSTSLSPPKVVERRSPGLWHVLRARGNLARHAGCRCTPVWNMNVGVPLKSPLGNMRPHKGHLQPYWSIGGRMIYAACPSFLALGLKEVLVQLSG